MIKVLTPKEVAEQLKISERTVIRLIENRHLSASKIGSQWRIEESALNSYFKAKSTGK